MKDNPMRSFEDLNEAISEGRGVVLDDGKLITTRQELDEAFASGKKKSTATTEKTLEQMTVPELRVLPEADGAPGNANKAELIATINAARAKREAEQGQQQP